MLLFIFCLEVGVSDFATLLGLIGSGSRFEIRLWKFFVFVFFSNVEAIVAVSFSSYFQTRKSVLLVSFF